MKVLIITQYFWPENFKISDFAVSFKEMGHEVCVLTGIPNYPKGSFYEGYGFTKPKTEYFKNIKIIRTVLFPRGDASNFRLFLNYLSFAFFASFAVLFRIKSNFDLIFVFETSPITVGIPAIVLKKIRKIPIVLWVLDLWPESVYALKDFRSKTLKLYLYKLVKYIYKNCNMIFVSSRSFIKSITEKNIEIDKIRYIPNWSEDEYLNYNAKEFRLDDKNLPEDGFILMFAGNLGEAQDFESIISAAECLKNHKDIYWIIIGDGRKKDWIKHKISEKGLSDTVILLGKYPMKTMPHFYSKADAMLIALRDEYVFSLTVPAKLQTYMACGKTILAMINGETAKIIKEAKAGFVCDSGKYNDFAVNILKLYSMDKGSRQTFGNNARSYYNAVFNKDKILKDIEKSFTEVINMTKV